MRNLASAVALCIMVEAGVATPQSVVSRAFAGKDSRVHVVRGDSREETVAPEKDQDEVQQVKVAPDGRTVGWLVNTYGSCCVSYSIPMVLVIWRDGHVIRRFHAGQLIGGWDFARGGKEITYYTEPLHGDSGATCYRASVATGKGLRAGMCDP
jgi:hypothetical protein